MKNADTKMLFNQLLDTNDIKSFIQNNRKHLLSNHMLTFINQIIMKKDLATSTIVNNSGLSTPFTYQILSGQRKPKRDSLIQLAFGLTLTFPETQRLLQLALLGELYPKTKRDALIIYGTNKKLSIFELDDMLSEYGKQTILKP